MVFWLNFSGVVLALVQVRLSSYAAVFGWLLCGLGSNSAVNADGFAAGYFGSLDTENLKPQIARGGIPQKQANTIIEPYLNKKLNSKYLK